MASFARSTGHNMRRWFFHHIGVSPAVTGGTARADATVVHGRRYECSGAVTQITRSSGGDMCRRFAC